jgi:Toastrack DUF4097
MRTTSVFGIALGLIIGLAHPALAQRVPFERSFDANEAPKLDVSTFRGKIDVTVGDPGRVTVAGTVTVRTGWNVPSDALEIARRIAARPPIDQSGNTIRLRSPSDDTEQRAVTVSYQVRVPRGAEVLAVSDSGAIAVRGVSGSVEVRTQSSAIDLSGLGGTADVTTGSGAVTVNGVAGALAVATGSSAFTGRSLRGDVRIRTQSGAVDAVLAGTGDVDVETGSSGIQLQGVRGTLNVKTRSGRVEIQGVPAEPWDVSTGSSAVRMMIGSHNGLAIDATTDSGSVVVDGAAVQGSISKGRVAGTIGGGGPLVRSFSRSGSIHMTVPTR